LTICTFLKKEREGDKSRNYPFSSEDFKLRFVDSSRLIEEFDKTGALIRLTTLAIYNLKKLSRVINQENAGQLIMIKNSITGTA